MAVEKGERSISQEEIKTCTAQYINLIIACSGVHLHQMHQIIACSGVHSIISSKLFVKIQFKNCEQTL
jgi:hypothetical protein